MSLKYSTVLLKDYEEKSLIKCRHGLGHFNNGPAVLTITIEDDELFLDVADYVMFGKKHYYDPKLKKWFYKQSIDEDVLDNTLKFAKKHKNIHVRMYTINQEDEEGLFSMYDFDYDSWHSYPRYEYALVRYVDYIKIKATNPNYKRHITDSKFQKIS